jgi:hypothetical protein
MPLAKAFRCRSLSSGAREKKMIYMIMQLINTLENDAAVHEKKEGIMHLREENRKNNIKQNVIAHKRMACKLLEVLFKR